MENQYFEDTSRPRDSEDEIIKRIKECEMVISNLATNDVWAIVLKDCNTWCRQLDSMWQFETDEKKLNNMRVLKLAYKHITDTPKKYKDEMAQLKEQLAKSNEIEKDYDE